MDMDMDVPNPIVLAQPNQSKRTRKRTGGLPEIRISLNLPAVPSDWAQNTHTQKSMIRRRTATTREKEQNIKGQQTERRPTSHQTTCSN